MVALRAAVCASPAGLLHQTIQTNRANIGRVQTTFGLTPSRIHTKMTTTWDHVLRTALINLHAFEFGYTVAFTGATLQSMIDAVDLCGGADLCAEASFVASAAPLGALLAAAVAGRLLDSYGRRTFLIAVSALWVVGYVVVACASSLLGFALGRAVAGAAMGATSVAVPVYSCVEITLDGVGGWCR